MDHCRGKAFLYGTTCEGVARGFFDPLVRGWGKLFTAESATTGRRGNRREMRRAKTSLREQMKLSCAILQLEKTRPAFVSLRK